MICQEEEFNEAKQINGVVKEIGLGGVEGGGVLVGGFSSQVEIPNDNPGVVDVSRDDDNPGVVDRFLEACGFAC